MTSMEEDYPLHIETPLLKSPKLSKRIGAAVWLKLDVVQNSGSFKTRGLGNFAQKAVRNGCKCFVSSSGGNAGLAAAFCAKELGLPITVVVPTNTPSFVGDKLREEFGAKVEVVGSVWDEANERALAIKAATPDCELIHPFDHPDIWEGHTTIVKEVKQQLRGITPDVIILSVGGGGLMNGVLQGMHQLGWEKVPIIAVETHGADSLAACAREGKWTELPDITSIACCLGAKRVSKRSFEWLSEHRIINELVTDREAVSASIQFADDHRMLLDPACAASMATVYGDNLSRLQKEGKLPPILSNVVVIVCGGSGVKLETMQEWKQKFNL